MSYAVIQDLINRVGADALTQLAPTSSDVTTAPVLDAARVTTVLADASAEIDTYLAERFTLPLDKTPAVLTRLCCDLTLYQLQALRPLGEIEDARRRHADALRLLHAIAKGEVSIGVDPAGQTPSTKGVVAISVNPGTSVFGIDALQDYACPPRY